MIPIHKPHFYSISINYKPKPGPLFSSDRPDLPTRSPYQIYLKQTTETILAKNSGTTATRRVGLFNITILENKYVDNTMTR